MTIIDANACNPLTDIRRIIFEKTYLTFHAQLFFKMRKFPYGTNQNGHLCDCMYFFCIHHMYIDMYIGMFKIR